MTAPSAVPSTEAITARHAFDCYGRTQRARFCPCGADEMNAELTRLRSELATAERRIERCRHLVRDCYAINPTYPPPVGLALLERIVGGRP